MIVADTNLVLALVVSHPAREAVESLFHKDSDWHAPDWWQMELANALRNYHRTGQLLAEEARAAMRSGLFILPSTNTHPVDPDEALRIACESNISAYDARFIALARSFRLKLVTEDARLRKACPGDTLSLEEALANLA